MTLMEFVEVIEVYWLWMVERLAGEAPDALMARADQALYRSKAAGKDVVSE